MAMLSGVSPTHVGLFEGGEQILILPKQAESPTSCIASPSLIWVVGECKIDPALRPFRGLPDIMGTKARLPIAKASYGRHGDRGVGLVQRPVEVALKRQGKGKEPVREPLHLRRQVVLGEHLATDLARLAEFRWYVIAPQVQPASK